MFPSVLKFSLETEVYLIVKYQRKIMIVLSIMVTLTITFSGKNILVSLCSHTGKNHHQVVDKVACTMASIDSHALLQPLHNQLQVMEKTVTNFMLESILKLQTLTETKVFLLLEPKYSQRRFCGSEDLIRKFKNQELTYKMNSDLHIDLDNSVSPLYTPHPGEENEYDAPSEELFFDTEGTVDDDVVCDTTTLVNDQKYSIPPHDDETNDAGRPKKKKAQSRKRKPAASTRTNAKILKQEACSNEDDQFDLSRFSDSVAPADPEESVDQSPPAFDNSDDDGGHEDYDHDGNFIERIDPQSAIVGEHGTSVEGKEFKMVHTVHGSWQLVMQDGWRYMRGKCRKPDFQSYYSCVVKGCPAKASTIGNPETDEIKLRYYFQPGKPHNHPPDKAGNEYKDLLRIFKELAHENPHETARACFEKAVSLKGSMGVAPGLDLEKIGRFSTDKRVNMMMVRIRQKHGIRLRAKNGTNPKSKKRKKPTQAQQEPILPAKDESWNFLS